MTLRLTRNNEFLLASIFMLSNISGLLTEIFNKLGLYYPTTLAFVIIFSIAIIAWIKMFVVNTPAVFFVTIIYALVLSLSLVLEPRIEPYIFNFNSFSLYDIAKSEFVSVLLLCFSLFLLGFGRANTSVLFRYLRNYAVISTIVFVALMIVTILSSPPTYNYMPIAYNALPGICILFLDTKLHSNKLSGILCILGVIFILVGGCRGALATIAVLWFMWWLQTLKNMTAQKFVGVMLLCITGVIALIVLPNIASILDQFFSSFGYSSRIIKSIIATSDSEGFLSFDSRNYLHSEILKNLNLFGHGIYSDRIVLSGTYAHNILLEVLYHFGLFFSIPIIVIGIYLMIHIYRIASHKNDKYLMASWVFLFSIVFVKLMVSSTYLSDITLWFCLGFVNICCRSVNRGENKLT